MATVARIASGMTVSWVRLSLTFVIQLLLIPIYLSYWDRETYGAWLLAHAIMNMTVIVDLGHQNFLQYEFLRLGVKNRTGIAQAFYSSVPIAVLIGSAQCLVVVALVQLEWLHELFHTERPELSYLSRDAGRVLISYSFVWLFAGSIGGIVPRLLLPFGYFTRTGWWGVFNTLITAGFPAIAVVLGANFLQAGFVYVIGVLFASIVALADFWRIMKWERLVPMAPSLAVGWRNFGLSLWLALRSLLDIAQQQMLRVVLTPMVGVAQMAAFVSMRTGANTIVLGLGTVTNPLLPELMKVLNDKDQVRVETMLGLVWLVVVAVMVPAIIGLQWAMPSFFAIWTRGQLQFDPLLFALISLAVLLFALAQPAASIVQGHNLLRPQLTVAATSASLVIGLTWTLVPTLGLIGAGVALLLSELVGLIWYVIVARSWMHEKQMRWPKQLFVVACGGVVVAAVAVCGIAAFPGAAAAIAGVALLLNVSVLALFWKQLPSAATDRAIVYLASLPPLRFIMRISR